MPRPLCWRCTSCTLWRPSPLCSSSLWWNGLAHKLAFTFMRPDDRPQFISYAISFCICCVMCPVMSLIATVLFKEQLSFAVWVQTWGMNLPCALLWQLCYCGPFVRLVFRTLFRQK